MITSFAEFLQQLKEREEAILAEEEVEHAPTIGDMYEGLTKEILEHVIPQELGLQLLDGFVIGADGRRSQQLDAMLVMGNSGRQIPRTTRWEWPIQDVLAVFEVKKNLYGADLKDSLAKMQGISQQQQAYLRSQNRQVDLGPSHRAFARAMGRFPRDAEMDDLTDPGGEILRTIAHEQLAPVRVVFGYEGYADEHGLRKGFVDYLEGKFGGDGVAGPAVLPNLIVCRSNSLVKLSGHPYISPINEPERWNIFGSERKQPFRLLIELLWTRLSNQFQAAFPMDDTIAGEAIVKLLQGWPAVVDGRRGWYFYTTEVSKKNLAESAGDEWSPVAVETSQQVLILMALNRGGLSLDDGEMVEAAQHYGLELKDFADWLVSQRLFAWEGETSARPITDTVHIVHTPDGKSWAANSEEILSVWIKEKYYQ